MTTLKELQKKVNLEVLVLSLVVAVIIIALLVLQITKTNNFKEVSYNNGLGTQLKLSFYKDSAVVKESVVDSKLKTKLNLMVLSANKDMYGKARLVMYVLQSSSAASQEDYKNNAYCNGLPTVFTVYNSYLDASITACSFKDALYYAPFEVGSTVYLIAFTQNNNEMTSEEHNGGKSSSATPPPSFGLSPYNNDIRTILNSVQLVNQATNSASN